MCVKQGQRREGERERDGEGEGEGGRERVRENGERGRWSSAGILKKTTKS